MIRQDIHKNLERASTYLSLNAFRILSTLSSRCKADASRLRSFSNSASVDIDGADELGPAVGFDDEEDGSEDIIVVDGMTGSTSVTDILLSERKSHDCTVNITTITTSDVPSSSTI